MFRNGWYVFPSLKLNFLFKSSHHWIYRWALCFSFSTCNCCICCLLCNILNCICFCQTYLPNIVFFFVHCVLAEGILSRDFIRLLSDINSCGPQLTSSAYNDNNFSSVDYASSSRDCNSRTGTGLLERDASYIEDQSFINSGLGIVNTYYHRGVRFIFKG